MIKSVQKAVQILQILSERHEGPTPLGEIADASGLNKSTCAHLLETLCECNMVEKVSRSDGYRLGVHVYYITRNQRYNEALVEICNPVMHWLKQKTGHSIVIAMLRKGKKVVIHRISGMNRFPEKSGSIQYENIYRYSSSHAILAAMTEVERAEFYQENGYPTREEWPKLYSPAGEKVAYDEINRRGYELFRSPFLDKNALPGEIVIGVSAPLFKDGKVVAALGVALPNEYGPVFRMEDGSKWRLTEEEERHITKHLVAAAREINRRLQY